MVICSEGTLTHQVVVYLPLRWFWFWVCTGDDTLTCHPQRPVISPADERLWGMENVQWWHSQKIVWLFLINRVLSYIWWGHMWCSTSLALRSILTMVFQVERSRMWRLIYQTNESWYVINQNVQSESTADSNSWSMMTHFEYIRILSMPNQINEFEVYLTSVGP